MSSKSEIKEQIKYRSRWTIYLMAIVAVAITAKIIYLQTTKKKDLLSKVADKQMKERVINATRGNIYASDGRSLLATSIPKYTPVLDPSQAKTELFDKSIDSLALRLSSFFGDKSFFEYKEKITKARKAKLRFMELGDRKLDHIQKTIIDTFPLFREGQNKGGGRFEIEEHRFLPFNNLAMRTIGKLERKNNKVGDFGIEASFENYLKGKDGKGFYERMAGGVYKPVNSESDIDSEPGLDVVTTIDVNFQDIVETALKNQVFQKQAKYGTAVIMEIATGEVKAIANLTRTLNKDGEINYIEDQNYAVKFGTDPGSTFKLATMTALLEKKNLNLEDFGVDCSGAIKHGKLDFTCSHKHGTLTVKQIFEHSCNIGIYSLMKKHFGFSTADDYFEYLQKFRLDQPSGFQLKGEPHPWLKNSKSTTFSRSTSVPWMSIGYESRITPIQMLTFYNAIANNGYWVQPIIVKETRRGETVIDKFESNKISEPICSENTVVKIQKMMEGVVKDGTAKNVSLGVCEIAGKTGTSQKRVSGRYQAGLYYTSFIGYFPAKKPKYSCIVVIDEPLGGNIYAADVSAPVFRNIADKIFAYDISMQPKTSVKNNVKNLPKHFLVSQAQDQKVIHQKLGLKQYPEQEGFVKNVLLSNDSVKWETKNTNSGVGDLIGMTLKDALPVLENKGYKVKYSGFGKIKGYSMIQKNVVALVLN
jgi:cell division protein FtsI (penicillin-binding protein 3)